MTRLKRYLMYENQTLINYCYCGSSICVDGGI